MAMKVAVVGGLGYVGNLLVRALMARRDVDVVAVDINMFDKYDDGELLRLNFPLIRTNFLDFGDTDVGWKASDFDVVVICCLPDVQDFYEHVDGCLFTEQYRIVTERCVSKCRTIVVGEHFDETIFKDISDLNAYNSFPCPVLYGTAPAFRNDTLINNMVLSFAFNKMYRIEKDPNEFIQFQHINAYVQALCNEVIEEDSSALSSANWYEYADGLPLIMLANMIQWEFGPDYGLSMTPLGSRSGAIEGQYSFKNREGLSSFIREIKAGVEKGFAQELYDEKYDNKFHFAALLKGLRFNDKGIFA